jgi:nitronate monooxygenase
MSLPPLRIGNFVSRLPIVQGGMGVGISLSGLASAVAEQGGIGVIAGAMVGIGEPDVRTNSTGANVRALQREIRTARQRTRGLIGVNIMVALVNYPDLVRTAIEEDVDFIFAGAGLALDLPGYRQPGSHTRLVPIVSSGRAASLLCRKWRSRFGCIPDAFVVEGPEAGGHLGFKPEQIADPEFALEKLVVEVIEAVQEHRSPAGEAPPVIAAGGVYTGADIFRFLRMGAAGVQMGTRFVATEECDADPAFKQAYVDAQPSDLTLIQSPVGLPGRALDNRFLRDVRNGEKKPFRCPYHCVRTCDGETSPYCIALALANARKGRLKNGFAFAGSNAWRVKKIVPVKELMEELVAGYEIAAREAEGAAPEAAAYTASSSWA